jgi:hypothetical protein
LFFYLRDFRRLGLCWVVKSVEPFYGGVGAPKIVGFQLMGSGVRLISRVFGKPHPI